MPELTAYGHDRREHFDSTDACTTEHHAVLCSAGVPASPRTVLARTDFWLWARVDFDGMAAYCSVPLGTVRYRCHRSPRTVRYRCPRLDLPVRTRTDPLEVAEFRDFDGMAASRSVPLGAVRYRCHRLAACRTGPYRRFGRGRSSTTRPINFREMDLFQRPVVTYLAIVSLERNTYLGLLSTERISWELGGGPPVALDKYM